MIIGSFKKLSDTVCQLIRYGISYTHFPVPYGIILLMQEKIMGMVTKTGISRLLILNIPSNGVTLIILPI